MKYFVFHCDRKLEKHVLVPRIAQGGSTFVRAGGYYLGTGKASPREERGSQNYMLNPAKRVGFTRVFNMDTHDAGQAFHGMQHRYSRYLEYRTGKRGRTLDLPVFSYSLSWSPEETPSEDDMLEAARETLDVLGMQENQAIVVQHRDQPHAHIHLIVNRVHPTEWKAASDSMGQMKLSRWAQDYEQRQGKVRCPQRPVNNERRAEIVQQVKQQRERDELRRARGEAPDPRHPREWVMYDGGRRSELPVLQNAVAEQAETLESLRNADRPSDQDAFDREVLALEGTRDANISAGREAIRNQFKPQWHALYEAENELNLKAANTKRNLFERACFVFRNRALLGEVKPLDARMVFKLVLRHHELKRRIAWVFRQRRANLGHEQNKVLRARARKEHASFHQQVKELRETLTRTEQRINSEPAETKKDDARSDFSDELTKLIESAEWSAPQTPVDHDAFERILAERGRAFAAEMAARRLISRPTAALPSNAWERYYGPCLEDIEHDLFFEQNILPGIRRGYVSNPGFPRVTFVVGQPGSLRANHPREGQPEEIDLNEFIRRHPWSRDGIEKRRQLHMDAADWVVRAAAEHIASKRNCAIHTSTLAPAIVCHIASLFSAADYSTHFEVWAVPALRSWLSAHKYHEQEIAHDRKNLIWCSPEEHDEAAASVHKILEFALSKSSTDTLDILNHHGDKVYSYKPWKFFDHQVAEQNEIARHAFAKAGAQSLRDWNDYKIMWSAVRNLMSNRRVSVAFNEVIEQRYAWYRMQVVMNTKIEPEGPAVSPRNPGGGMDPGFGM